MLPYHGNPNPKKQMTPQQFTALVKTKEKEIRDAIHRRLPVKIGRMATDHFQDNFRRSGYVDGGLHPWPVTRRQQNSAPGGSATVTTHPHVTPKMRKYAWAQFFKNGGKGATVPAGSPAGLWKALALTKKDKLTVTAKIPQRKFLGQSQELSEKVSQTVENEIKNILNS